MSLKIRNQFLEVEISKLGAEIISLKKLDGDIDVVFKKDERVWGYQSPLLFPKIGSVSNKVYSVDGVFYQLANHGFARNKIFDRALHENDKVELVLKADEETLSVYPYLFEFKVIYTLCKNCVNMQVEVINKDDKVLPFEFGYHPAFTTYGKMYFECEKGKMHRFNQLDNMQVELMQSGCIELKQEDFTKENTLIYSEVGNVYHLISDKYKLTFTTSDFDYVALWSKQLEFVCVEPWSHVPDVFLNTTNWIDRNNVFKLEKNASKSFEISILIN